MHYVVAFASVAGDFGLGSLHAPHVVVSLEYVLFLSSLCITFHTLLGTQEADFRITIKIDVGVKIMLHTENWPPRCLGSVLKVCGGGGVYVWVKQI